MGGKAAGEWVKARDSLACHVLVKRRSEVELGRAQRDAAAVSNEDEKLLHP